MKHINKIILSGFVLTVVFSCFGFTAQSQALSENLIRLHVKANSDSEYDQELKLIVKDEISVYTQTLMDEAESLEEAEVLINDNLANIEAVANECLQELNCDYTATVSFEMEYFPTREYETFTLPAGDYTSLKISLGQAQGENWWCVVYPSLCTSVAISSKLSESEEVLVTETPKISFKIYEVYLDFVNFLKGVEINENDN